MNKRLLFYINAINGGGAERVILQLASHFADDGYECRVLTSFVDRDFEYEVPQKVRRESIEQDELKDGRIKKNIRRIKALRKYCYYFRPDMLISFMAEPNIRAVIATIGLDIKTIISVRNDPSREYSGMFKLIGKYLLPIADGCVFQTEDAKRWFPKKLQRKSKIIVNEVSTKFFEIERSNESKNIVAIGRLCEQKNYPLLIEAYSRICDKVEDDLLIYGDGYLKDELKNLIELKGLSSRVKLMGQTDNVVEVLQKAKIFVLSSYYEGMPNALMEALAAGVPSISTDCPCGGPRALISDGVNGYLVSNNDPNMLSDRIFNLLNEEGTRKKMSENARKFASEMYKPDKIYLEWKQFAEAIISRH